MPEPEEPIEIRCLGATLDSCAVELGPYHAKIVASAHQLAIAFWSAVNINQAVCLPDRALQAYLGGIDGFVRSEILRTLGQIMAQQAKWEQAQLIYRDVLECCTRRVLAVDAR